MQAAPAHRLTEGMPVFAHLAQGVVVYATVGERVDERFRVYDPDGYSFVVLESELELV